MGKKKDFKIEDKSTNLGGLNNLFKVDSQPESKEVAVNEGKEQKKDWKPQTFNVYESDYAFFQKYSLYMGFNSGQKYTLIKCFNDAMNLLREKHPDIKE